MDIPVADPEKVKALSRQYIQDFKAPPPFMDRMVVRYMDFVSKLVGKTGISAPASNGVVKKVFNTWGTSGLTVFSGLTGDTPVKNWGGAAGVDFTYPQLKKLSGPTVIERQKRRYACQACPMGCGGLVDVTRGKYKGAEGHKPEYETLGVFGAMLLNDDLDSIIEVNELCNRSGIDTISTGAVVAFAIECYENGLISADDLGGLEPGWGKADEIVRLTEMIINREGFGDVLADGVKRAAERIGRGAEHYAMHAGGQELGMHDSRPDPGWAVVYQSDPTPGRHTVASYVDSDLRSGKGQFPAIDRMIAEAPKEFKKLALTAATAIYVQLINAAGVCLFAPDVGRFPMVEFLNAVTGWNLSADDYFKTGKRILSLRKAFSAREGVRPKDQALPARAIGRPALGAGPLKEKSVEIETLEKEYYSILGWDLTTGGPTRDTMKEMEIDRLMA
jgi:aldehyde:ferredoxin oxidoreductase